MSPCVFYSALPGGGEEDHLHSEMQDHLQSGILDHHHPGVLDHAEEDHHQQLMNLIWQDVQG